MHNRFSLTSVTSGTLFFASLGFAAFILTAAGCKKNESSETDKAADTAVVLPEPPELDSLEDVFADDDFESMDAPSAGKSTKSSTPGATVKPAAPNKGVVRNGAYTLQVAILSSEAAAQKRATALIAQGYPAYVSHVFNPKPGMNGDYYRVRIGSFATSAAARDYGATNLAPAGIDYWADLKGRDTQPVNQVYQPKQLPPTPAPAYTPPPPPAPTPAPTPAPPPVQSTPEPVPGPPPSAPAGDTEPAPKLPDW